MFLNRVILIGRNTGSQNCGSPVPDGCSQFHGRSGSFLSDEVNVTLILSESSYGETCETCANYMGKGRLIAIEGRLQVSTYQASDGQTIPVRVVADTVRF